MLGGENLLKALGGFGLLGGNLGDGTPWIQKCLMESTAAS